jgi:threonine synthase
VRSTRDESKHTVALDAAMMRGLAGDGGLYVPTRVPPLPSGWWEAGSLAEMAEQVLAPWWGDDAADVAPLLRDALPFDTPLKPLSDGRYLLELFHGPTLSFKDVGARSMARLTGRLLNRDKRRAIVLVATSGDTGSAVADGFAGVPGVDVVLLYPKGLVSDVQERQLIVERPSVHPYAVEGDFDACQRLVKEAFRDPELVDLGLTSANSINVGRLLPQMLYYLWGAVQLKRQGVSEPPLVVVPSGNLGNLTAGLLAWRSGMPAAGFHAAHNANQHFADVLKGQREPQQAPATVATISNAMDVGAPSNLERVLDDDLRILGPHLSASVTSDAATLERMRVTFEQDGELVCPHTAVGLEGLEEARRLRPEWRQAPAMVLATAHPAKFPDAVRNATGVENATSAALEALQGRPTRVAPLAPNIAAFKREIVSVAKGPQNA